MANLKDRTATDRIHALVYGDSGVGKTHLIGSFPDPYIIDTDYGIDILSGQDIEYDEYYVRVGDEGAKTKWTEILAKVEEFTEDPPHATLVIDSLTTLTDVAVAYILGKTGRTSLQLQDYTPVFDELTKLIIRLRRVPVNVVVTAHEETLRDEYRGRLVIRPLVIGKEFPKRVPIYFNNIYCAMVDKPKSASAEPERYLLVQSDGTRIAKTQAINNDVRIGKSYDSIIEHLNKTE